MRLRIKEICKKQGVLQKDIADKLGITDIALRASLKGNPTIGTLEKVASALNVHISELFEKDIPNDNTIKCPNCGTELELNMVDMVANKLAREYNVTPDQILKDASFAEFLDRLPDEVQKDILSGKIELK